MNKLISLFCFTLFFNLSDVLSQSLTFKYYDFKNKGDSALYIANDTNLALQYFVKAFEIANHRLSVVNLEERIKVIELSILKKDLSLTKELFFNAIENGLSKKMIETYSAESKILNNFIKSDYFFQINNLYDSLFKIYLGNSDFSFEYSLISLMAQDQFSRRISTIPKFNSSLDPQVRKELLWIIIEYSDCEIKNKLIELLKSKSFSDDINDNKAMGFVNFLLLHNLRNFTTNNKDSSCIDDSLYFNKIQPILLKLVHIGKLKNSSYSYLIDRANCWNNFNKGVEQIYGSHLTMYNGKKVLMYPIKDINNVDKRRAEIFLNTLYEYSIISGFELPPNYTYKK
jgi:hypothetical protein